jgi:hypothetical protein
VSYKRTVTEMKNKHQPSSNYSIFWKEQVRSLSYFCPYHATIAWHG